MLGLIHKIVRFLLQNKFSLILLNIIGLIFMPVFIPSVFWSRIAAYIFITFMMLISMAVFSNIHSKRLYALFLILVSITIVVNWLDFFQSAKMAVSLPRAGLLGLLFVFMFVNIFQEFQRRDRVDIDYLFGAISGYFLLGIIGTFLSMMVESLYPGSFQFSQGLPSLQDYIYFNFVSLTTLGYGDILPLTPQGKMYAIGVTITGQLYLAITIALVVGNYLSHKKQN